MEIILTQDVPKLGYKGDVLKVRPGYARNYLMPQGFAIMATESNRKMQEENQKQAAHKLQKVREEAEALATELENTSIEITAKAGTSGKIFGSVTTLQIAQSLKEKGYDVDRRRILLNEEIKNVGTYQATIDLHKHVKAHINLIITPEGV